MTCLGMPSAWLFAVACISLFMVPQAAASDSEVRANRMQVDYIPPTNPAHQKLYEMLKERRALEKLQAIFSPFRLPIDLTLRTVPCDGVSNAWWRRPDVSVCYEYLAEILRSMPKETTAEGVTPADAVIGQFFYVFAHEMGHAMFEMLEVPVFGNAEDAADHFAVFLMLKFERNEARGLIVGSAYSYRRYVQSAEVTAPLVAFSDAHSAPAQRFFNLLCLAYGSDTVLYGNFVENGHLPKGRVNSCKREYEQVALAFRKTIVPHLDLGLAKKVSEKEWFPEIDNAVAKK
jgi:Putative metallopeptidase